MADHVHYPPIEIATDALLAFLDTGATTGAAVQNFNAHKDALVAAQGWDALPDVTWHAYDVTLGATMGHGDTVGGVFFDSLEAQNDASQVIDTVSCGIALVVNGATYNGGVAVVGQALRRYGDCLRTMLGRAYPINAPTRRDANGRTLNNGGADWYGKISGARLGSMVPVPDQTGRPIGLLLQLSVSVEVT